MNIKIVSSIWQYAPVFNFNQLGEYKFLGPNLPPKTMNGKIFLKRC